MMNKEDLILYAVTDRAWLNGRSLAEDLEKALKGGVTLVQLREKEMDEAAFIEEAKEIKKLTDAYNVPLIINDAIPVALAVDAAGVHVGQDDMEAGNVRKLIGPDKILGVTAKTFDEVRAAVAAGADYIGSGAVFGTTTKKDAKSMTIEFFTELTAFSEIPVVAIGGITAENAPQLIGTGCDGIAVVSAIFAQEDIQKATEDLLVTAKKIASK